MGAVTTKQETSKSTNLALDIHFIDTTGAEVAIVMPEDIPSLDAASHVKLNTLTLQVRESIHTWLKPVWPCMTSESCLAAIIGCLTSRRICRLTVFVLSSAKQSLEV